MEKGCHKRRCIVSLVSVETCMTLIYILGNDEVRNLQFFIPKGETSDK